MKTSDTDLKLISGDFLYGEVPVEYKYLLHYFKTNLEKTFLSYYLSFEEIYKQKSFKFFFDNFLNHTGCICQKRWVTKLIRRVRILQEKLQDAYKNSDIEKVTEIKTGKFVLNEF